MALAVCLAFLMCAGCSGKNEESKSQDQAPAEPRTEKPETEKKEQKQLKQAELPLFIPNGIRSVSLTKDGEEFLHISGNRRSIRCRLTIGRF